MNAVTPPDELAPLEALRLVNVVGGEMGCQTRLGWREWCTGLAGLASNEVRSVIPFTGTRTDGSSNKLFAATQVGIYDCTTQGVLGAPLVSFVTTIGDAGYVASVAVTTQAGGFLMACDEANGLYRYSEPAVAWTRVPAGTTVAWANATAYQVGDRVVNGGNVYVCDTAGTSAVAPATGPSGTGANIVDGSTRWDYVSASVTGAIGPSLADQRAGLSLDPANLVFAAVWKSRVWLVERNTTRAWYLEAGAVAGTANSFDFGAKMSKGGALVGLWNWSYDNSGGMETLLVGVSSAGDVVIYQGTDPASASTFGIKGCWSVGGLPKGRRIATDFGGEMLLLSTLGSVPLSKLVVGAEGGEQYQTQRIQPIFNQAVAYSGHLLGWSMVLHPNDNTLLVLVPAPGGQEPYQLAMSFATKGWSVYEDLPMFSAAVWQGLLYFGTTDGRVCVNDGALDARLLSNPNSYSPITWKVLTGFRSLGQSNHKHPVLARVSLKTGSILPVVQVTARYDFDTTEPDAPVGLPGGSGWDVDRWDVGLWSGELPPQLPQRGVVGVGRDVALWLMGNVTSRTTLIGVDLYMENGGVW
jgi:hypothetical protein